MKQAGAAWLVLLFAVATCPGQEQALVRIHVADAYGNTVSAQKVTVTAEDGTTTQVESDDAFSVKYGRYTVRVRVPGFAWATDAFLIGQPEQILFVTMKLADFETPLPRCAIEGNVTPAKRATRVRLLQLFGSYSTDVPIAPSGSFRLRNLDCGDYMLIVTDSKGCVGIKMIHAAPGEARTEVRLSESQADACEGSK
jgi:hypothetical protein